METKKEENKGLFAGPAKEGVAVVDVVFMCDCTGSMGSYMSKAKDTARQILSDIKTSYSDASVFFAFIGYRDHCDTKLLEHMDLTGDVEEVIKFIDKLSPDGGGDEAEAVVDALNFAAHKISWRPEALRQLVHILDAPPHGKEFGGGDDHPKGCPCKLDYKKILKELDAMGTEYMVLNFTPSVDKMVEIYKKYHSRIENVPLVIVPVDQQQAIPYAPPPMAAVAMAYPSAAPPMVQHLPMAYSAAPVQMFEEQQMQQQMIMPGMYQPQMDIQSQVTMQMAQNISTNVVSNVKRRFKK